ncbi:MAG: type II secretion system protein [Candidatus Nealsonbacteria bacterium]
MRGFTLIETIITIAIFVLVIGVISGTIIMLYRIQGYTWQQSISIDEARRGIEVMVKEIREARYGDNGAYPIEKADNKELIFYSDIDKDGSTERVRYFLGSVGSGSEIQECQTFLTGGSCSVTFSNFFQGNLLNAEVKVSVDGDFGLDNQEYAEIYADGNYLDRICMRDCSDCLGAWQGDETFDITEYLLDGSVVLNADASYKVDPICSHSMKANFELFWTGEITQGLNELKKGVINPVGYPPVYPAEQEEISILTSYVRNVPPIFTYFDEEGEEITENPAKLINTKMMKVYLIINVNPERSPTDFELKSAVQLRNLKE